MWNFWIKNLNVLGFGHLQIVGERRNSELADTVEEMWYRVWLGRNSRRITGLQEGQQTPAQNLSPWQGQDGSWRKIPRAMHFLDRWALKVLDGKDVQIVCVGDRNSGAWSFFLLCFSPHWGRPTNSKNSSLQILAENLPSVASRLMSTK